MLVLNRFGFGKTFHAFGIVKAVEPYATAYNALFEKQQIGVDAGIRFEHLRQTDDRM